MKKRFHSLALALVLALSLTAPILAADQYDGIVPGAWYEPAAKEAVDNGIMIGTDKGFEPEAKLTRAQVVQIFYNLEGKPTVGIDNAIFRDVDDTWYQAAARWAAFAGIVEGSVDGGFGGDEVIARAETAQLVADYARFKGLMVNTNGTAMEEAPDYESIPAEYLDGMTYCYYGKVMTGDQNGNLLPAGELSRAEMAVILKNFSGLKGYIFDAEHPYDGVKSGLFNSVTITAGEEFGIATYYLPKGLQPWAPAVIVLTPDNTTAKAFAASETGLAWRAVADANKIGLTFLEPAGGETWNLSLSADGRNDAAILNQLFMTMRSKGLANVAPFTMDKSHTTLVGYGEGGAAALLFGARYATDFSGICAVDAAQIPAASLDAVGEELVLPFPGDSTNGVTEMNIKAKTVDTPVWFVNSADKNAEALSYYIAANDAEETAATAPADSAYQAADSDARVWVSAQAQTPEIIYRDFLGTTKRFMAMQEGGRVAFANDFTKPQYKIHEEEVNGELRRWITYVPTSYDGSTEVPLVLVMHGYTASMYAIAGESRWYDVAEENGFIVVFAQALVRETTALGNIPAATWSSGYFSAAFPDLDPMVDVNFINSLLDKCEAEYEIDAGRVYATGHSNGSMMTWDLGEKATARFAAVAPIGAISAPTGAFSSDVLLPTWAMVGEFDSAANAQMIDGNANVTTLKAWNEHNGVDETKLSRSKQYADRWETMTFANEAGVPLVRFTEVLGTPHVYLQEQAATLWEDFFSKYNRDEDGTLYYEGKEVKSDDYVAASDWYSAAAQ